PRSEDWPNRSCRSFLIVNLSFSINSARYCASLSAAVARSSAALSAWRCATMSACALARSVGSESSRLIGNDGITSRCTCELTIVSWFTMPQSAGCLRSPGMLRHPPVDALEQVAELCRCDSHHSIGRRRPDEAATLQSLRKQAHALSVMPQDLEQSAAAPTEHEQMPAVRIMFEYLLYQQRQAIKAFAHVGMAGGQPNPRAARGWDHRRRLPFASAFIRTDTVEASTGPEIRIRPPLANSISMTPVLSGDGEGAAPVSAGTATGWNTAGICTRSQSCWRQRNNWLLWIPAARATSEATAPGSLASAIIRSFSVRGQCRRRCTDVITSTCAFVIGLALGLVL